MHDTLLYVKGMFFIYLCNFLMMGGNCPGGNCPGGNCPVGIDWWELSGWELS